MSYGGAIAGITGYGDLWGPDSKIKTPTAGGVGQDYLGLLNAYSQGQPTVLRTEQEFHPQYVQQAISELSQFGPQATRAYRGADPSTAALLDKLLASASQQLDLGRSFDPTDFENYLRGGQAARGLGHGPADAIREAIAKGAYGEQLLGQRQQFAQGIGAQNAAYNQPALGVLGAGPTLIPSNATYDMFNTTYNAQAARNIAQSNKAAASASY